MLQPPVGSPPPRSAVPCVHRRWHRAALPHKRTSLSGPRRFLGMSITAARALQHRTHWYRSSKAKQSKAKQSKAKQSKAKQSHRHSSVYSRSAPQRLTVGRSQCAVLPQLWTVRPSAECLSHTRSAAPRSAAQRRAARCSAALHTATGTPCNVRYHAAGTGTHHPHGLAHRTGPV